MNKGLLKIKEKFKKNNKKNVENLVFFLVVLIITIIIINTIWKKDTNNNQTNTVDKDQVLANTKSSSNDSSQDDESNNEIQSKLEDILSKISGVGKVKVLLTYSQTSTKMPIYNEENSENNTEESDTSRWNQKGYSNRY